MKYGTISKYDKKKIIIKMIHKEMKYSVFFIEDPDDNFLINVLKCTTKSGTIISEALIIRSDIERRIEKLKYEGFEVV